MRNAARQYAALLGLTALVVAVTVIKPGGEMYAAIIASIDILLLALSAVLGVTTAAYFGLKTSQGRGTAFITAALCVWLAADVMYYSGSEVIALFSYFVYFLAYPFLIAGIIYGFRTLGLDLRMYKVMIPAIVILIAAGLIMMSSLSRPWLSVPELVLAHIFTILNIVLIVPAIFIAKEAFTGFFSRPWALISVALALNVAGQVLMFIAYPADTEGTLIDAAFCVSYILLGASFIAFRQGAQSVSDAVMDGKYNKAQGKAGRTRRAFRTSGRKK